MGTESRSSLELVDALGDLGTRLEKNAGREQARVGFEVLERNLGAALDVLADVARNPQFPKDEVDRERKRELDALAQVEKSPNRLASRVRDILAYGAEHPYGSPAQGLPGSVERITRADLVRFHDDNWTPAESALVFVGDVTLADARKLARKSFGSWSGDAPSALRIPDPDPIEAGRIYLIDRPDAAQTVISMFLPAPKRASDDYYALRLADAVWGGGGFGTRLNLNLREDKGYSYGVFSNLALRREHGLWFAGGGVQTDKTAASITEFHNELTEITGTRPISSEEFEDAKVKRVRGYAQQFESLARVAGQIGDLWTWELDMNELERESTETLDVTLKQARAAAKRYARADEAILLLVGDRSKIEGEVRALDLGEIVLLDSEGRPLKEAVQTGLLR